MRLSVGMVFNVIVITRLISKKKAGRRDLNFLPRLLDYGVALLPHLFGVGGRSPRGSTAPVVPLALHDLGSK